MRKGLLEKADLLVSREIPLEPGSTEKAAVSIRGRIEKIPRKETAPYIALCLMKARGGFSAGTYIVLEGGTYSGSVTVGRGLEKVSLPAESIFRAFGTEQKYFRLDENAVSPGVKPPGSSSGVWVFPMDAASPWRTALLVIAEEKGPFDPEMVSSLLDGVVDILAARLGRPTEPEEAAKTEETEPSSETTNDETPDADSAVSPDDEDNYPPGGDAEPAAETAESVEAAPDFDADTGIAAAAPDETAVSENSFRESSFGELAAALNSYSESGAPFGAILALSPAGDGAEAKPDLSEKLAKMVSRFGSVAAVNARALLVLVPKNTDKYLIAHRLRASLRIDTPLVFDAENAGEALEKLKPFL